MKKCTLLTLLCVIFCTSSFAFISQGNWRWRNNNGSETSATWKAAENQSVTINSIDSILRLRIQLQNTTGDMKGFNANLQVASAPDGPWRYVTNYSGNNPFKITMINPFVNDLSSTTQQLSSAGNTFAAGKMMARTNELDQSIANNTVTEYEYSIQPTENISANTTYYFKVPGIDYPMALPSIKTTSTINTKTKIVSNGSFENGIQDWTFKVQNLANATYNIVDSIHKDGLKSILVDVVAKGALQDLRLTHKAVHLNVGHVYLVRFWAKAKRRSAQMKLVVSGNTKILPYNYKLYTGWQEFQFAFKAVDAAATINFLFTTLTQYSLDKIEVLDENNGEVDVPMNYMWQNNRPENEYAWLSADGENSELLPDGRTVWTFSDGWYGYNDTTTNSMSTHQLLRNSLVVQTAPRPNGILNTRIGGTVDQPRALMVPPSDTSYYDNFFWPRDFIVENDSLKVLLPQVVQVHKNDALSDGHREAVGVFSLPDLTLRSITWMPWIDSTYYIALCKADDGYTYAYGSNAINSFENHAVVARFPTGQLNATTPWQFLTDTGWSFDSHHSKEIADVQLYSVTRLGRNNYVSLFMNPLSDKIEVEYAQSPIGPWVSRSIVGQTEGQADILSYFALLNEETAKKGVYTFSYSNIGDIGQMLDDKTVYWPSYQRADLKSLSPFTDGILAAPVMNFTAREEGRKALLQWKTVTETNNDHFIIQRSADGKTAWKNISTVKSKGNSLESQSYSTYDVQPLDGDNYYQLIQVDKDGNNTPSVVRVVNIKLVKPFVEAYPNPSGGDAFLALKNYSGNSIHVKVLDMNGRVILNRDLQVTLAGDCKIPFASKPAAGIYSISVSGVELDQTIRIVMQ